MNAYKQAACDYIDSHSSLFTEASHKVWEYAELSLMEYKSAAMYEKLLAENGFEVESGMGGMKTAFCGKYGHGHPIIGILGEFDALSGLSQKAAVPVRDPLEQGGTGHGCGHNMLGAGSLAAAFAVKDYLEKSGKEGTVIYYGCPGEEGGAGKAFLAKEHVWEQLDAAITWHPGDVYEVTSGTNVSCIQKEYKFTGLAAHAAGSPDKGRSALDAVELMNIGVQFLREHMPSTARIHYAITDAGGNSPNVVQPEAQVLYMVRDVQVSEALALQKRVDKIAEAAAMMTDTSLKVRFIDGTANTVANSVLEKVVYANMQEIGIPAYTDADKEFASAVVKSYDVPATKLPGKGTQEDPAIKALVKELSANGTKPINDYLIPLHHSDVASPGSTDVGDVSWQNVACGNSPIGDKGLIAAGKYLAGIAIDLYEDPSIIEKAAVEHKEMTAQGYMCPIPEDAVPTPVGGKM